MTHFLKMMHLTAFSFYFGYLHEITFGKDFRSGINFIYILNIINYCPILDAYCLSVRWQDAKNISLLTQTSEQNMCFQGNHYHIVAT